MLSVIVPTYNEAENVRAVARRVHGALDGREHEIVFVDDSRDETPAFLADLAAGDARVRFEHREGQRGLATAVLRGFELAHGDALAVLDGDLQHPPELLPQLASALDAGADVAVASRFVPGGQDAGLSPFRRAVSAFARHLARLALHRIRRVTDPTSGFFMLRRSVVEGVHLEPSGWKILIEVLARGRYRDVREVPYRFAARAAGRSKMSGREVLAFLVHLARLVATSAEDRRFFLFSLVGTLGVGVNLVTYTLLVRGRLAVVPAGFLAACVAMLCNFVLNDGLVWIDLRNGSRLGRVAKYVLTSLGGIVVDVAVLDLLHGGLHVQYVLADLAGIAAAICWNFQINKRWTWAATASTARAIGDPLPAGRKL